MLRPALFPIGRTSLRSDPQVRTATDQYVDVAISPPGRRRPSSPKVVGRSSVVRVIDTRPSNPALEPAMQSSGLPSRVGTRGTGHSRSQNGGHAAAVGCQVSPQTSSHLWAQEFRSVKFRRPRKLRPFERILDAVVGAAD
jgi:hypothetical protein